MAKKHKVLIRRCDDYDTEKIYGIIKEGMEELNVRPSGRILLKPNEDLAPRILKKLMYQVISHSKRFGEKRKISNSAWSILTVILAKTAI